jgi:hypothetical protein
MGEEFVDFGAVVVGEADELGCGVFWAELAVAEVVVVVLVVDALEVSVAEVLDV